MPKNNIRLLTEDERRYLNQKYSFDIEDGNVLVKTINYGKVTKHPLDKTFAINTIVRKITISAETLAIWSKDVYKKLDNQFTLIDVQNVVNMLTISYQEITNQAVISVLKEKYSKTLKRSY